MASAELTCIASHGSYEMMALLLQSCLETNAVVDRLELLSVIMCGR